MAGFTKEQKDELKELFNQQQKNILGDVRTLMDTKLDDQHSRIIFDIRTLIQDLKLDLADIRERLDRLVERTHEESTLALKEIEQLKQRVDKAERKLAALKH